MLRNKKNASNNKESSMSFDLKGRKLLGTTPLFTFVKINELLLFQLQLTVEDM